jgi:G3E family GTPase
VRGAVPDPLSLIGSAGAKGAADWGLLDEHRNLIKAVQSANCTEVKCTDPTHNHDHSSHSHAHDHADVCTDPTHNHDHSSHSHAHEHHHHADVCTDPTHNHDHSSHSHVHEHHHADVCSDPTHNHDHSSHSHAHEHHHHDNSSKSKVTTAQDRFGISSFVYQRRRPFHPIRFSSFLQDLGLISVKSALDYSAAHDNKKQETTQVSTAARALLRSKGFVWMATSSQAAYFMSHAGQYLELLALGRWWAAIDRKEWPIAVAGGTNNSGEDVKNLETEQEITVDFQGTHGDRRQELVFIGKFAGDAQNQSQSQSEFERLLDACLLTDEEMQAYERITADAEKAHGIGSGDTELRDYFVPNFKHSE